MLPAELVLGMDGPLQLPAKLLLRLLDRAQAPRGVWVIVVIAFALTLPAIATGLSTDDHIFAYKAQHGQLSLWSPFALAHGAVAKGITDGTFAWWTSPNLHAKFFRPLATLSHLAEFQLWPQSPWAMHLLNSLLYAAMVAFPWALYRELAPGQPHVAALAALMFAIDDGHAVSVGWISGRNTLLASVFALAAFWLHVRARADQRPDLLFASAACTALALTSAEAGLGGFSYFVAYALAFERGSLWQRAVTLAPQLGVLACWVAVYIAGDFGVRGASLYRELSSPLVVLSQGVLDLPTWLMSLLGPRGSNLILMLPENPVRLGSALICLPLLAALAQAVPRTRANAFFALGALGCLPPLFTTHPQDRLLMLASFGGFGLLASFISVAAAHPQRFVRRTRSVLFGLHIVLAPICFVPMLAQTLPIEHAAQAITAAVPLRGPKQVIVVSSPLDILSMHVSTLLASDPARTPPESLNQLYTGASRLVARRIDARTLELIADEGWGNFTMERTLSTVNSMPRAGSALALQGIQVLVVGSTPDSRPQRVQFRFSTPLEAPDRLWLAWQGQRPVTWKPPSIGETVTFPARYLFSSLPITW